MGYKDQGGARCAALKPLWFQGFEKRGHLTFVKNIVGERVKGFWTLESMLTCASWGSGGWRWHPVGTTGTRCRWGVELSNASWAAAVVNTPRSAFRRKSWKEKGAAAILPTSANNFVNPPCWNKTSVFGRRCALCCTLSGRRSSPAPTKPHAWGSYLRSASQNIFSCGFVRSVASLSASDGNLMSHLFTLCCGSASRWVRDTGRRREAGSL